MGIDWIRRTEEKFKHHLKEASVKGFNAAPLFPAEERQTVTIPCHWLDAKRTLPVRTKLTIYHRAERARLGVLHGTIVVAEVRGEASRDLRRLFMDHPELCSVLAVEIVRVGKPTEPFYVRPVETVRKKGKLQ